MTKSGFLGLVLTGLLAAGIGPLSPRVSAQRANLLNGTTMTPTQYHGWTNVIRLGNGIVEARVVPAVGRVMQFRFVGEADGPFWENAALFGQQPDAASKDWGNFGGDKTWPAPQADWGKVTPRQWPPPQAFDSLPVEARTTAKGVILVSPVDPHYGIRTSRTVELSPRQPVMSIRTVYEKVQGAPVKVGIWVITQLKDPVAAIMPVPGPSLFSDGYNLQSKQRPPSLSRQGAMLLLTRDAQTPYKIGNDAGSLLWVGDRWALRIDSPRVPKADYPDQGSSAEIYTSPDPLPYVELEMLGPLHLMKVGDRIERTSTYTLFRRTQADAASEARKILTP